MAGYLVVAITVLVFTWLQYGFDPHVYFLDDFQVQYLPAVTLPTGFHGRLAIEYVPAGPSPGIALALVGLASLIALVVVTWTRRRRALATA